MKKQKNVWLGYLQQLEGVKKEIEEQRNMRLKDR